MFLDNFGAARLRRLFSALSWLSAVACVALSIVTIMPAVQRQRDAAIVEAQAWTIDGPPCPSLPPAEAARSPYQPTRTFGYAGSNFGFVFGHVACAEILDDGGRARFSGHPVCQFTSPAVVAVDTGAGTAFFTPGLGRRATVSVESGVARCVMAGHFYGQRNF